MSLVNASLRLGEILYEIDDEQGHVQSIWPDGKSLTGIYQYTDEDIERARSLGYKGTDEEVCSSMHREHDLCHHLVMQALGWKSSVILRYAAEGKSAPVGIYQMEEHLAFLLQRAANKGLEAICRNE